MSQHNPYSPPVPVAQPGAGALAMASQGELGELRIYTSFFPLMWVLFLVSTGIEINGQKVNRPWGWSSFALPPGNHRLKIYFNYMFGPAGVAEKNVAIYPGHGSIVHYDAPWLIFLTGNLREQAPKPFAQLPPPPR